MNSNTSSTLETAIKEPPDYNALSLTELKELARKYGLRPGSKQVMVKQLLKIWNYLHISRDNTAAAVAEKQKNDDTNTPLTTSTSTNKLDESNSDSDNTDTAVTTMINVTKEAEHQHSIIELSTDSAHTSDAEDSDDEEADILTANLSRLQVQDDNDDANAIIEHLDDLDDDILPNDALLIYDGQDEEEDEEDEEGKEENDIDTTCELDIKTQIIQAIQQDKQLYTRILHYNPIEIEALHKQLSKQGIVCTLVQLRQLLDNEGIVTYSSQSSGRRVKTRCKINK